MHEGEIIRKHRELIKQLELENELLKARVGEIEPLKAKICELEARLAKYERMRIPHQVQDVAAIAKEIRKRKTMESPAKKSDTKA